MKTSKIKIVVSRSRLKRESAEKPIVKKVSKPTASDDNYYQKAVEALYEAIDVLSLVFVILKLLTVIKLNNLKYWRKYL